jgi:hypothetical protein
MTMYRCREQRAREYFGALKSGRLKVVREIE